MIDKRTFELLNILNGICVNGSYKILSFDELVASMPKRYTIDADGVRDSLNELKNKGYINIKYEDDNEICLSPLPKGRLLFEEKIDETIEVSKTKKTYFWYSFLGSFLGGAIILAITMCYLYLIK